MTYSSAWTAGPAAPAYAPGGWTSRPRYAPEDFVTLLWREKWLMLVVFLGLFGLGLAFAFTLKSTYPASASVLVRLGQEYVYEPRVGDAARGAVPDTNLVIQSEVEILNSVELRERVVRAIGVARIDPEAGAQYAKAPPARREQIVASVADAVGRQLKVESAPDTSVIRLSYSHRDARVAAQVLNQLLDEYRTFRRQVLVQGASPASLEQVTVLQGRLSQAENALRLFMLENGIGDFDSEKAALNMLYASLVDESFRVQARQREVQGRLGELNRQAGSLSPEIGLFRDANPASNDRLLQLKIEREELLSRYKPDADPVREIDRRIAQVQAMIDQGRAQSQGASRTGPNPVYQTVQTERIQLSAEAASLQSRAQALAAQIQQVSANRTRMIGVEPRYQALLRDRDLLAASVRSLAAKTQEDQAAQAIALESDDNIRIVERATPPLRGKSLKLPVAALSLVFAAFTALCVGLLRMFLRPGLPTPAAASRTLDLPVLATARYKA